MEKFAECVQDSEQLKSALLEMQVQKNIKKELNDCKVILIGASVN